MYLYVLDIRNLEKKEDREKFQELFVEQGGWPTHVAVKKLKADFSSEYELFLLFSKEIILLF